MAWRAKQYRRKAKFGNDRVVRMLMIFRRKSYGDVSPFVSRRGGIVNRGDDDVA